MTRTMPDPTFAAYRRSLRARNRSDRTIQSYEESLAQLADFQGGVDLLDITQADIEEFMADVLTRHRATTAAVRFRSLRAFYNWAAAEEYVEKSPMATLKAPKIKDERPPSVTPDADLRALLKACNGKDFDDRRDTAIIRVFCEPGSPRVAEMAGLDLGALDLDRDQISVLGKGGKRRVIPFGPKTGQALDRYLAVRRRHPLARLQALWLGGRGTELKPSGIYQMLERRCHLAGIGRIHPHQLRHTAAHVWFDNDGSESDAMELFGWSSPEMTRVYGRAARTERAHRAARRTTMADRL